jgi:hypothetical protein
LHYPPKKKKELKQERVGFFSALQPRKHPKQMDGAQPPNGSNPEADDQTVEIDPSSTILDLTSFQLHDLSSVDLSSSLAELDLTANRLSSLDPRIAHLSNLKKLSLRQNLIDDAAVEPFSRWDSLSALQVTHFSILFIYFWLSNYYKIKKVSSR